VREQSEVPSSVAVGCLYRFVADAAVGNLDSVVF
jgi:hypothetical protein